MLVLFLCAGFVLLGCLAAASLIAGAEEEPSNAERQAEARRQAGLAPLAAERIE